MTGAEVRDIMVASGRNTDEIKPTEDELATIAGAEDLKETSKKEREKLVKLARHDNAEDLEEAALFNSIRTAAGYEQIASKQEFDDLPKLLRIRLQTGVYTDSRGIAKPIPSLPAVPPTGGVENSTSTWICKKHRIQCCSTCRSVTDAQARVIATGGVVGEPHKPAEKPQVKVKPPAPTVNHLKELEKEVAQLLADRRHKRLLANPPKDLKRKLKEMVSLRKQHGYTPRELAECLDEPGFNERVSEPDYRYCGSTEQIPDSAFLWPHNQHVKNATWCDLYQEVTRGERTEKRLHPRTMDEFVAMLPRRWRRRFSKARMEFYRDYAYGNVAIDDLKKRLFDGYYGRRDFEVIQADGSSHHLFAEFDAAVTWFENEIVERGEHLLLLFPKKTAPTDFADILAQASDQQEALEGQWIDKSGAAGLQVFGGQYKTTEGKTFQRYEVDSFEHSRAHEGFGPGDESGSDGPDHDDYSDEGSA